MATVGERQADFSLEIYLRAERQSGNLNFANGAPENRLFVGVSSRFGAGLSGLSNVAAAPSQLMATLAEVHVQTSPGKPDRLQPARLFRWVGRAQRLLLIWQIF